MLIERKTVELKREYVDDIKKRLRPLQTVTEARSILE